MKAALMEGRVWGVVDGIINASAIVGNGSLRGIHEGISPGIQNEVIPR